MPALEDRDEARSIESNHIAYRLFASKSRCYLESLVRVGIGKLAALHTVIISGNMHAFMY